MTGGGGRFLVRDSDETTKQPTRPHKSRWWNIRLFAGSERKPTAPYRAVGPSGRAGRESGRVHQEQAMMHATRRRTTTAQVPAGAGYSIAHVTAMPMGRKLTPFVPTLTLRVGMKNRRTAGGVPTLPTLPRGVRQRGRKSTPPFGSARAHWERATVGRGGTHE